MFDDEMTNLIVGNVDHHERQEAEQEAAENDEHHAGESQVIASLVFLRRVLLALFRRLDDRKVGFFLSASRSRTACAST